MTQRITVFAEGLDHPEGVAVHPDGSVWCGGEAGQIYRIEADGRKVEEVANTGGFVLGLAFSPDLKWLAVCDMKRQALLRLDLGDLRVGVYSEAVEGRRLRIPNYPVFDRSGRLWVSDSGAFGQCCGGIFLFDAQGRGRLWAGGELNFANGLALDPAEEYLYVVESFLPAISRYRVLPDGSAGDYERYVDHVSEVPDGLAFDTAGNLYCSCYAPARIYRIDPARRVDVFAEDPTCHQLSNCTNIAYGGPDHSSLFAANLGRWHISKIESGVRGAPLASHAPQTGRAA